MKNHTKFISLLLSVIMMLSVFTIVPLGISAQEAEVAEIGARNGKTGDCTWSLDGTILTISGNGKMEDYRWSRAPWGTNITKVIITNGVTNIGYQAFPLCTALTRVTIPDSVTEIGSYAFSGCTGLTGVTIPDSVTNISDSAFYNCTGLTSITIPDSVTHIDSFAFFFCSGLESIAVAEGNTVYDSRENCNAIIETNSDKLLLGCKNTVIPHSVTSIDDNAFRECSNLTSITIPDSVTSIGDRAFYDCTGLTSITIPDSVSSIGTDVFFDCTNLKTIEVSENHPIFASVSGILYNKDLTEIVSVPNGIQHAVIPDSATFSYSNPFYRCSHLEAIEVSENHPDYTSVGGILYNKDITEIVCVPKGIRSVFIPDSVILSDNSNSLFRSKSTETIEVSENHPYYTAIGGILYNKDLTEIVSVPGGIRSADIPDSITSIVGNTFSDRSNLASVTIPDSVTTIGNSAFSYCTSLTNVTIPNSVTKIGDYAFSGCSGLTNATISNSVTRIPEYAFNACTSLTSIDIPASVKSINQLAFYECRSLERVTIPDSVTSIYLNAFCSCDSLKSVTIPKSVTYIGKDAFGYHFSVDPYESYKLDTFTIYGYTGTKAESYANNNGFTFIDLNDVPEPKAGDADGDGEITLMDVTEVQHLLSSMNTNAEEETLMFADVDKNGVLEIIDATFIQRCVAGMEIPYQIG